LIDWETSGANFGGDSTKDYQGIAFGAVIFNVETMEEVASIYRELNFDDTKYKWSAEAERIHGISREHLTKHGISREEALIDLLEFIATHMGTGKIFMAGHNSQFDRDFTTQLASDFGVSLTFHHVNIDTAGICYALLQQYRSDDIIELLLGVKRGKHNALEDARLTLQVLHTIKHIFMLGMQQL
jgi:DNA polymerase III epsilon subunit-like protein